MKHLAWVCLLALSIFGLSQGCSPAPNDEVTTENAAEANATEPSREQTISETSTETTTGTEPGNEPTTGPEAPGPEAPGPEPTGPEAPGPEAPGPEPTGPEAPGPEQTQEAGPEAPEPEQTPEDGPEPTGPEVSPEAGPEPTGPEVGPEPTPEPGPEAMPEGSGGTIPTNGTDLLKWLQAGNYKSWPKESKIHGGGIHGQVLVFINNVLDTSLKNGNSTHTVGSASVKELYSGGSINGYAVMVKVSNGSGGSTWYWYEIIGSNVVANGTGVGTCTGCHSSGKDYFKTQYPLQ